MSHETRASQIRDIQIAWTTTFKASLEATIAQLMRRMNKDHLVSAFH